MSTTKSKFAEPVRNLNFLKYPYGDSTQYFGENPALYKPIGLTAHNGWDIVRPYGEHLFAVEDGIIASTKEDPSGYGKNVRLLSVPDENGRMRDWVYGHLSFIAVKPGDKVKAGQFIGAMGNTGFVVSGADANGFWDYNPYKGTHLHLGVRDVVHDGDGWRYDGYPRKIRVVNAGNGYKGRYDPTPLFSTPKALYWAQFADRNSKEVYWQLANILRVIKI